MMSRSVTPTSRLEATALYVPGVISFGYLIVYRMRAPPSATSALGVMPWSMSITTTVSSHIFFSFSYRIISPSDWSTHILNASFSDCLLLLSNSCAFFSIDSRLAISPLSGSSLKTPLGVSRTLYFMESVMDTDE